MCYCHLTSFVANLSVSSYFVVCDGSCCGVIVIEASFGYIGHGGPISPFGPVDLFWLF